MRQPELRRLSLEEYTELDAVSESRLEFRDGLAVALAIPTKNHERIAGNLVTTLGRLARDRGCDYYAGGAKVVTPAGDRLIPDFLVTCDDRDRELPADRGEALAAHPWLIVEILSPATAVDDVTVKFDAYQTIAELRQYVVIDSRRQAMRDAFVEVLREIVATANENPQAILDAPVTTIVGRIDETRAARQPDLRWVAPA